MIYPDCVLNPFVLGPDMVPVITDPEVARRSPELTVLSALTYGARPDRSLIFPALLAALQNVGDEHERLYYDLVFAGLPPAGRVELEELMTVTAEPEFRSEFLRDLVAKNVAKGRADGEAKGEAKAVLAVLAARGIDLPDHVRERVTACTDLDQLDIWIRRAATATTVDDLYDA